MEVSAPVTRQVVTVTQGRKKTDLVFTSQAECRALIKQVALAAAALPDDGEDLTAPAGVRELDDEAGPLDDEAELRRAAALCQWHGGEGFSGPQCSACLDEDAGPEQEDAAPPEPLASVTPLHADGPKAARAGIRCPWVHPSKGTPCIGGELHGPPCRDLDGDEWVPGLAVTS